MTTSYVQKVKRYYPNSFVGYWPLNENDGSAAYELSSNGYNGTATACSQADRLHIGPDGGPCYYFDGSTSYVDIYAAISKAPTTIGSASVWFACQKNYLDGTTLGRILTIGVDANNVILIEKTATANTFRLAYIAGGTTKSVSPVIRTQDADQFPAWHHLALTWTATGDALKVYVDGAQSSTTQSSVGTWSGTVASNLFLIGGSATTPSNVFKGWIAHPAIWSVVLTAADIADLAIIGP